MDNFYFMCFGEWLWICLSWCDVLDENVVNVMFDLGLVFGIGMYLMIFLCLQWLDGFDFNGKMVIDFGCGFGILVIVVLKLGVVKVIGIDIDLQVIQVSCDNVQCNGVFECLEFYFFQD